MKPAVRVNLSSRTFILYCVVILLPISRCYLFGCYFDYGQPSVIAEQLPINVCTHVLLIGSIFVQNRTLSIVQHPYNGSDALQAMRDYRQHHSNRLKFVPSLLGDDIEWQRAIADEPSRQQFISSLIEFARLQVDFLGQHTLERKFSLIRTSMDLILIGNIHVEILKYFSLYSSTNYVWRLTKHSVNIFY